MRRSQFAVRSRRSWVWCLILGLAGCAGRLRAADSGGVERAALCRCDRVHPALRPERRRARFCSRGAGARRPRRCSGGAATAGVGFPRACADRGVRPRGTCASGCNPRDHFRPWHGRNARICTVDRARSAAGRLLEPGARPAGTRRRMCGDARGAVTQRLAGPAVPATLPFWGFSPQSGGLGERYCGICRSRPREFPQDRARGSNHADTNCLIEQRCCGWQQYCCLIGSAPIGEGGILSGRTAKPGGGAIPRCIPLLHTRQTLPATP